MNVRIKCGKCSKGEIMEVLTKSGSQGRLPGGGGLDEIEFTRCGWIEGDGQECCRQRTWQMPRPSGNQERGVFWEHERPVQPLAESQGECGTKGGWSRQGLETQWEMISSLAQGQ